MTMRLPRIAIVSVLVAGSALLAVPSPAQPAAPRPKTTQAADRSVDVRRAVAPPAVLSVAEAEARASLASSLGRRGVFDLDPRTGTARFVGRLDGTLTAPSSLPAPAVAMGWARRNAAALGLDRRDLRTFHLSRDYVDIDGTHHLAWTQSANGIEAFDNGLLASVTADGRLVNVSGSPAHGLGRGAASAPAIGRDQALARAAAPGVPGHATLVYFHGGRSQLAWRTDTTAAPGEQVVSVIDATTGDVLWRADLAHDATGTGSAWGYFPSSKVPNGGGTQQPVTFPVNNGNKLLGNNAHVFLDAGPDHHADPKDEVAAGSGLDWSSPAILDTTTGTQNCAPAHPCSWDYRDANSWRQNLRQSATQAYYFVNTFHDHLLAAPIGFTEAAGNFQTNNPSGKGKGHDAVQVHAFFGANSGGGVPIPQFTNNASMSTPPDGRAPTLVLLLFRRDRFSPGFPSANPGDDASIVYHEYTHGLSGQARHVPERALGAQHVAVGGDGGGLERLVRDGSARGAGLRHRHRRRRRGHDGQVDHRRAGYPLSGARLPSERERQQMPRCLRDRTRRLHLRRLRPRVPRARGALRRRDLGADPVGPSRRARRQQRPAADHTSDGAVAAGPVVPRHAQRDPAGRPGRLRQREQGHAVERLPPPRDGVFRVGRERQRHGPDGRHARASFVRGRSVRLAAVAASPTGSRARRWRASASRSAATARASPAPTSSIGPMRTVDS